MSRRLLMMLSAGCLLVLLAGGLMPGSSRDAIKGWLLLGNIESTAHFVLSAMIVLQAVLAFGWRWWIPVLTLVLGALIEVLQYWVPGRSPSWTDFGVDGLGVLVGLLLAWIVKSLVDRECNG